MINLNVNAMTNERLIASTRQNNWGCPAVLNFILGGAGAGGFIFHNLILNLSESNAMAESNARLFIDLSMPMLVLLGFSALGLEAGKPLRSRYLVYGFRNSWMSRETLAFILFMVTAITTAVSQNIFFQRIAILSALTLLITQGFILYKSRGIAAWNTAMIPALFLSSGLTSGAGLNMILWTAIGISPTISGLIAVIFLALTNVAFWLLYLFWSEDLEFSKAIHRLQRIPSLAAMLGLGHFLPVLLVAFFLMVIRTGPTLEGNTLYIGASGILLVTSTFWQKFWIISSSGYQREIRLKY
jgi:formate-dependent nitrite reductase membrane component NrfD